MTSSVSSLEIPERDILITSANVKIIIADVLCLLMRMALAAFRSASNATSCEVVNLRAQCLARGTELRDQIRSTFLLCLYSKSKITRLRLTPNRELS